MTSKAASAPIKPDRNNPTTRWFDDPLRQPNQYATLRDCIEGQAKQYGHKTFLIDEETGREFSYHDLDANTSRCVNLFRKLGADNGARIGILDANTPEMVWLYLGCMKGGFVSCPLNYHLKGPELQFCLENSESQLLFVSAEFWPEVAKVLPELAFLRAIVLIGKPADITGVKLLSSLDALTAAQKARKKTGGIPPILNWDAAFKVVPAKIPPSHPRPTPDTDAEIIYTSGTTGKPKGVVLRHHQFLTDAKYIARWYRMTPDTRMMMVLPLFHVNAEVVTTCTPLVAGGSVVMFRKFSASRFWPAVEKYRVHIISVVPTLLTILNQREHDVMGAAANELGRPHPRPTNNQPLREKGVAAAHDISSLRQIICGAAPLPAEVQLAFERTFLVPVIEGYGLSETTCYSTFNPIEGWRKIATIGVAVGNQVAIWDEQQRPQPTLVTGEIVIRGENVMREYFNRKEANREAFAGGWFHSGDVGDIDCDGFVRIRDRIKDMIIRGGENIYPREIDEVLYTHPAIENAATIGIPDNKYGEEVASFVVLKPEHKPSDQLAKEIMAYCKARLADYKTPKSVSFVPEIPKGPTGKLLRRELRRMAAEE